MVPIEELLRSSGQYGPAVPVPDDADAQTRMLGFIGPRPRVAAGGHVHRVTAGGAGAIVDGASLPDPDLRKQPGCASAAAAG